MVIFKVEVVEELVKVILVLWWFLFFSLDGQECYEVENFVFSGELSIWFCLNYDYLRLFRQVGFLFEGQGLGAGFGEGVFIER